MTSSPTSWRVAPAAPTSESLWGVQVVAKIVEAKLTRSEQPLLFLRMHIAQYKLVQGDLPGTKALIEAGKESLDSLPDVRRHISSERALNELHVFIDAHHAYDVRCFPCLSTQTLCSRHCLRRSYSS